ncbi:M16 family metallopeptidase [Acinetobacter sp. MD2(2019)]|uniref:M16 family metallopeptidase n=1 Tax=Acinetobacter sp. MD2(2019) TaxID=2605273 RepID=UPI002D1E5413|nr:insulinase family protein [Acinetobacter sp. MD2(2019)]
MRFKTMTLMWCFWGITTAAYAQPILEKSSHNIEEYRLDNGLRVVLAPNGKADKVFMNMVYLTGSLNDPKGKGGLAHLLEHLAFKGTKNLSGEEFRRQLDQYTTANNAYTEYYSTVYTNTLRPDFNAIEQVLALEAQRMDALSLPQKYVASEIQIVRREREMRMDQPGVESVDALLKAAYGNQSLGRLPIGDLKELTSIQHNELQKYYRTWYAPNNAVMVMSGNFDKTNVLKAIEHNFAVIPARTLPHSQAVSWLDLNKINQRHFVERKGSHLTKNLIYLEQPNDKNAVALSFAPYLYTLEPNGVLYKNLVVTGKVVDTGLEVVNKPAYTMTNAVALYTPKFDANKVETALIQGLEQENDFKAADVQRVKNLFKNGLVNILNSSSTMASVLTQYVVDKNGKWDQFFIEQQAAQDISVDEINRVFKQTFTPKNRIVIDILPTAEDQKKALQASTDSSSAATKDKPTLAAEPLKNIESYQADIKNYLSSNLQKYPKIEQNIQRSQLKNGLRYALNPTATPDDQVYAKITFDFGDEKSLWAKDQIKDLTAYLLTRGSTQHSLQDIQDQSIAANGTFSVDGNMQGMTITIQADKTHFNDYFNYIVNVLKHPAFSASEFDLAKSQTLASFDRSYTEPATVAGLVLQRLTEHYQPEDVRYHTEPAYEKLKWQQMTNQQIQQFYAQFVGFNQAQIAITGAFDAKAMQGVLQNNFSNWSSKQPHQRIISAYQADAAQKVHALAEKREFGFYAAEMNLPVGDTSPDAPALYVLSEILCGSQLNSRLGKELREKRQLIYGFGSEISLGAFSPVGALSIATQYTPGKADQVSAGVHAILQDLIEHGVTEIELESAKAKILKKRASLLDDSRKIQKMLNSQLSQNMTMQNRADRDQAYANLTKADVDAVIKKYILPSHLVEVMADAYGTAQPEPKF